MRNLFASLALGAFLATPAAAREIDRAEIAEDFVREVPQEQRVFCSDTQVVTLIDGTPYRACMNWRAEVKTRLIRIYATLEGPETDSDANIVVARECFDLAVASQNDPERKTFDQDRFIEGARGQFVLCATTRALSTANQYSLAAYDRGVWLGGT